MRFKQMKVDGKTIDALLIAGGPNFKIYGHEDKLILKIGRNTHVFNKNTPEYEIINTYSTLKYHLISDQEKIKNRFLELVSRLKNPSERYDRLMKKMNPTVRRGSKLEQELEAYESLFGHDEDEQQIDLNQLSEYEKMLTFTEKQNPKGLASVTTKKLKEIMDEPFKRGTQGADFEAKYGIEEIESEYYKRSSKESEKEMKKELREQEQHAKSMAKKEKPQPKPKKQFPITLNWEVYESLKETYAFLEIPDFPFYNVRIYFGNFFTVYVSDGYKTFKDKDFKTLDEAVDFAEREFLALVMNDKDYDVNIGSVVK